MSLGDLGLGDLTTGAGGAILQVDRLATSLDSLSNAQIRATIAGENLAEAIKKHGANSEEARKAAQELEIANTRLEISHTRLQERMLLMATSIIPEMIGAVESLTVAEGALDIASAGLALGLPIALMAVSFMGMAGATAPNLNVYGDVNVQAPPGGSTAQFAMSVQQQSAQSARP